MRKIIAAILLVCIMGMLTACDQRGVIGEFSDPNADIQQTASGSDDVTEKPEPMLIRSGTTLSHYNICLTIPDGWEYEILKGTDNADYCFAFWPAGETEGRIKMAYFEFFGVCGTGLTEEKIVVGNYEAQKGTYDNHWLWDYISFIGTPGSYVAINDGAEKWWNTYGEEAMEILSTVKIADDITVDE